MKKLETGIRPYFASACQDESYDVIISKMFVIDAISKITPEEKEEIQSDFAEAFYVKGLVQANIFSVDL